MTASPRTDQGTRHRGVVVAHIGTAAAVLGLAAGLVGATPAPARPAPTAEAPPDSAIAAAVAGGATILCRHAITDDFREQEPVDYADPSTQRRLSPEGEQQSRAMGQAMRALGVDVTELVASPMDRAIRTAELMVDQPVTVDSIWHTNGTSYRGRALERRLAALAAPVPAGTRLIVSHIGTISSAVPEARRRMAEGDCVVLRGDSEGHRVLGFVPWAAWGDAAPPTRTGG